MSFRLETRLTNPAAATTEPLLVIQALDPTSGVAATTHSDGVKFSATPLMQ